MTSSALLLLDQRMADSGGAQDPDEVVDYSSDNGESSTLLAGAQPLDDGSDIDLPKPKPFKFSFGPEPNDLDSMPMRLKRLREEGNLKNEEIADLHADNSMLQDRIKRQCNRLSQYSRDLGFTEGRLDTYKVDLINAEANVVRLHDHTIALDLELSNVRSGAAIRIHQLEAQLALLRRGAPMLRTRTVRRAVVVSESEGEEEGSDSEFVPSSP